MKIYDYIRLILTVILISFVQVQVNSWALTGSLSLIFLTFELSYFLLERLRDDLRENL